ncbi:peptidoglycan-binding protein [Streptomyces sp. NPDC008343]|uniref:peptidoglycan-binding domain-containing protein n=1 Tax=Streptomyces sp. NPDC008343 TaxID=3364828 RepID=UPI0036EADCBB
MELGDDAGAVGPAIVEEVPQEARDSSTARDLATQGDAGGTDDSSTSPSLDEEPLQDPPRTHHPLLIAAAGTALVVLLTGAVLGGLHLYDSPSRARAASDDVRPPVPDSSTQDGTSPEGQSAATATASPASDPASSPGKRPTDTSATPANSSPAPTTAPSTAGAGTSAAAPEPTAVEGRPPVLRLGDEGPEVTELQLRLRQIGLYTGDIDGDYDRAVEGSVRTYQLTRVILREQSGIYGTATRTSLESETSEP